MQEFNYIATSLGKIELLLPVDGVKDRLSSLYHWGDKEGLEQAVSICIEQTIDLNEVERGSIQEGQQKKFAIFKTRLSK